MWQKVDSAGQGSQESAGERGKMTLPRQCRKVLVSCTVYGVAVKLNTVLQLPVCPVSK